METREAWLHDVATRYILPRIAAAGGAIPEKYRLSVGFPRGRKGRGGHAIGQCWSSKNSADGAFEIFISPVLGAYDVIHVLAHEFVHASVGLEAGHKAPFKRLATAIGLEGKMTATIAGAAFKADIERWLTEAAPYPHAVLKPGSEGTGPGSRLLKATCEDCGYTLRVTAKWANISVPECPNIDCNHYHTSMVIL